MEFLINDKFVVSAGYESDVFKPQTTNALVTIENMTDFYQHSVKDSFKPNVEVNSCTLVNDPINDSTDNNYDENKEYKKEAMQKRFTSCRFPEED